MFDKNLSDAQPRCYNAIDIESAVIDHTGHRRYQAMERWTGGADYTQSLIRLPRDSEREAEGKTPLIQLQSALGTEPVDVGWFDNGGGLPTLRQVAARHALEAEWDKSIYSNPTLTRRRLSARARTIWAAIADKSLEQGDARRKAFASFDQFNSGRVR